MDNPGIKNLGNRVVTAALTDEVITSGTLADGSTGEYVDRLEGMNSATIQAKFDYGSGGTACLVIIETSINQGGDWIEVARFDFATADAVKTVNLSAAAAAAVASVATLGSEGKVDGVLGDRLRAKITSTGTYAGSTQVSVRAAVR
jgi:hypothetical protein